jgi:NDP-sugar pyrophosphorylase family protein
MILAAGRGTRLGSLGLKTPKVLVPIAGEPLLARQLRYLSTQGCDRVVINAHHLAGRLETFVAAYRGPLELRISKEPVLLGTAGGVRNALSLLGSDPFLVLYGDVLIDEPLGPLFRSHARTRADATVALYEARETEGKGVVEIDEEGRVSSFVEKGHSPQGAGALVNAGVYVLTHGFVEQTTAFETEVDFGNDVWPAALAAKHGVFGHVLDRPVIDVGTPDGLERARAQAEAEAATPVSEPVDPGA